MKVKALTAKALAKKRNREAVGRVRSVARARRARLATEFRAKLARQLPAAPDSASTQALIEAATSAYVQTVEVTAVFLRANASAAEIRQLTIARGQLQRCLRALNLIERDKPDDAPPPSLEKIMEGVA